MVTFAPTAPTLPNMHAYCRKCNAPLVINEEWHTGRCLDCQQWEALFPLVDAVIALPIPPKRSMNRDA